MQNLRRIRNVFVCGSRCGIFTDVDLNEILSLYGSSCIGRYKYNTINSPWKTQSGFYRQLHAVFILIKVLISYSPDQNTGG